MTKKMPKDEEDKDLKVEHLEFQLQANERNWEQK